MQILNERGFSAAFPMPGNPPAIALADYADFF
jgi:hypothetical protein